MKKKNPRTPKPRHVWAINPKSRVTPSKKTYARKRVKDLEKRWPEEFSG